MIKIAISQPAFETVAATLPLGSVGFSKKVENHARAMALHFLYYNFVRIHKTLKITPAMAAGVTDRLWEVSDMVNVIEAWEAGNI